jgi:hypothetical protein
MPHPPIRFCDLDRWITPNIEVSRKNGIDRIHQAPKRAALFSAAEFEEEREL